jgi:sec-independent protein translocase protein TatA
MANLGPTELFIILIIVILLFGVGRVARIGGELGSAVRAFREGVQGGKDNAKDAKDSAKGE